MTFKFNVKIIIFQITVGVIITTKYIQRFGKLRLEIDSPFFFFGLRLFTDDRYPFHGQIDRDIDTNSRFPEYNYLLYMKKLVSSILIIMLIALP